MYITPNGPSMGIAQSDGSWLIMSRKKGNDKDNQNEKKSKVCTLQCAVRNISAIGRRRTEKVDGWTNEEAKTAVSLSQTSE